MKVRNLLFVVISSSRPQCPIVRPPPRCWWQLRAVKTFHFQFMLFGDLSDHSKILYKLIPIMISGRKREIRKRPNRVSFSVMKIKNEITNFWNRWLFLSKFLFYFSCYPCSMGNIKMLSGVATNIFHVKTIRCRFGWNFIRIFEHLSVIKIRRSTVFVQMLPARRQKNVKHLILLLRLDNFGLLKM